MAKAAAKLIPGKPVAEAILARAADLSLPLKSRGILPTLMAIHLGTPAGVESYLSSLDQAAARAGVKLVRVPLPRETGDEAIIGALYDLAEDEEVHGVLLLQPLPGHLDEVGVLSALPREKDVEGVHPENLGRLLSGGVGAGGPDALLRRGPLPATPRAVLELLRHHRVVLRGKEVVVVGGGRVGLPLSVLLLREGLSMVTVCDRGTEGLKQITRRADVLCVAAGKAGLVRGDMIKPGAVVVDVGINATPFGIVGDVEFGEAAQVAAAITPVPGGVGPVTAAVIVEQTVRIALHLEEGRR